MSRRLYDDERAGLSLDTKDAALRPYGDRRDNQLYSSLYSEVLTLVGRGHFPFPTRRQLGLARRRFRLLYTVKVLDRA